MLFAVAECPPVRPLLFLRACGGSRSPPWPPGTTRRGVGRPGHRCRPWAQGPCFRAQQTKNLTPTHSRARNRFRLAGSTYESQCFLPYVPHVRPCGQHAPSLSVLIQPPYPCGPWANVGRNGVDIAAAIGRVPLSQSGAGCSRTSNAAAGCPPVWPLFFCADELLSSFTPPRANAPKRTCEGG